MQYDFRSFSLLQTWIWYWNSLKDTLKQSNISTTHWQDTATDRSAWRRSIHDGLVLYDDSRRERNATKRARRHAARNATSSASQDAYMCRHCCCKMVLLLTYLLSIEASWATKEHATNKRGRDTWQPSSYRRAALLTYWHWHSHTHSVTVTARHWLTLWRVTLLVASHSVVV